MRHRACLRVAVVWVGLVAPDRPGRLTPAAFARIPVEGAGPGRRRAGAAARPRRIVAAGRRDPVRPAHPRQGPQHGLLRGARPAVQPGDRLGQPRPGDRRGARLDRHRASPTSCSSRSGSVSSCSSSLITASTIHVTTVAARHRRGAARGRRRARSWSGRLCAALSLQLVPGAPVASASAAGLAVAQVQRRPGGAQRPAPFEQAIHDPTPQPRSPLRTCSTGLRGKDVLVAFVESYGQVAVQGTSFSPGVDAVLRQRTARWPAPAAPRGAPCSTSPTFGGISWLAHSTLQSGLWVDSQQRYDQLVASDRFTLSDAFGKAGWRTVADDPADDTTWPQGTSFYHYDQIYDRDNVGYRGPTFSYAPMPDQYTLAAFQRLELGPGHKPVMAEIDLVSSHMPWTPLPTHGALGPGRRRLDLRPACRRRAQSRRTRLAQPEHRPAALRPVDPVLAAGPHLVGHRAARRQPRARPARRPPASTTGQRRRRQPRGADLDRRPRPGGARPDRARGTGRTGCCPSPTAPLVADGRLPQPVPRRLQHPRSEPTRRCPAGQHRGTARAFWLQIRPGHGEIRDGHLPGARAGRRARPDAALGRQPRHGGAGLPRRGAGEPARGRCAPRSRRATSPGR